MKHLVILAGGASSRMKATSNAKLTQKQLTTANAGQKGLIVLDGDERPVLDYLIKNAAKAGFIQIVLITGENQDPFNAVYGNDQWNQEHLGIKIKLTMQRMAAHRQKPWGTADALQQAMEQVSELQTEVFAVCNCDNLYSQIALSLLIKEPSKNALVAYDRDGLEFDQERISKFAAMLFTPEYLLKKIIEKPSIQALKNYKDAAGKIRVSMNLFKFNGQDIYPALLNCKEHSERQEKELPTALLNMIDVGIPVKGIPLKEHVPDLTGKGDIAVFKQHLIGINKKTP